MEADKEKLSLPSWGVSFVRVCFVGELTLWCSG